MKDDSARDARTTALLADTSADLLRYFRRRARPQDEAADLLAELFLAAWRKRQAIPEEAEDARMWLFGVAHNTLRNWVRGRRRQEEKALRLREELRATNGAPDLNEVRAAIDRLPANQAELVRLVHWEGFSVVEAARILGLSESTARGRYQRARTRLAEDPDIVNLREGKSASSAASPTANGTD
jgi:RNA polymerase sigma-70 factor (ECF subfamily)